MRYIMDDDTGTVKMDDDTGTVKVLSYSNQFENLDAQLFDEPKFR